MSLNDTKYYRARAIEEAALAKKASGEVAAAIHAELAHRYQALVDEAEGRPPVDLKTSTPDVSRRLKPGVLWVAPAQ